MKPVTWIFSDVQAHSDSLGRKQCRMGQARVLEVRVRELRVQGEFKYCEGGTGTDKNIN